MASIFNTDRRIRLGIWGLGRGKNFIKSAQALNISVVAGCDFHQNMREHFFESCPGAYVTDNEDDFLAQDFDAVVIATYCPEHARHAIKALRTGKHVLSEVTAYFTPAQGVELVEAVEASGKVYNLAENYPFSKENMYLAKLYREGFFGELTYAEYEYVHGGSNPCVAYPDGEPMSPGNQIHPWRGWLNYHYYCTHSLGPVMIITGLRPEKVVAFPEDVLCLGTLHGQGRKVDGILPNLGAFAPSLIHMSNGGIVRNLMGGTTADSHNQRLFGTKAAAELYPRFNLKVGADGSSHWIGIEAEWDELGDLAVQAGHGGGDFWELYYFARQILTGEKAPWDIYSASDVTIAGIQALRSAEAEGQPMEVPDFRQKSVRNRYRNDHWMQKHIDADKIFPDDQDPAITYDFAPALVAAKKLMRLIRAALDAIKVFDYTVPADKIRTVELVKELRDNLPEIHAVFTRLRKIHDAYPESMGGVAIREKLELCEYERVMDTAAFTAELNAWLVKS